MIVPVGAPLVLTVSTASLLSTLPKSFVTLARNRAPLSGAVTEAMVRSCAVAPAMSAPLRCHW